MDRTYIEEQIFESLNFEKVPLPLANYENCQFLNCNFSNSNLSDMVFSDCVFKECNLSMATLIKTAFREVQFTGCKLLGLHFDHCNEFINGLNFDHCILNISSFYKLKLKKIIFSNCSLIEVDFAGADLTASVFNNCDMAGAIFENTILEKADFTTAYHYNIDPEMNKIKKAVFSTSGIAGLLTRYDIEIL
jgi:fluoroquinolone resistance protein